MKSKKHQLDATLCKFYSCRVTLHVSGASAHHQEYLKLVQRPLVHVLSLQVSHHISLLGPELSAREGIDLTIVVVRRQSVNLSSKASDEDVLYQT